MPERIGHRRAFKHFKLSLARAIKRTGAGIAAAIDANHQRTGIIRFGRIEGRTAVRVVGVVLVMHQLKARRGLRRSQILQQPFVELGQER